MEMNDPKKVGEPILNLLGQRQSADPLQDVMNNIREVGKRQAQLRSENIDFYKKDLDEAKKKLKQVDLMPLAQFTDAITGSNLREIYKSPKDNTNMINYIQKNLQAEQTGAVEDQMGVLKAELDLYQNLANKKDKYAFETFQNKLAMERDAAKPQSAMGMNPFQKAYEASAGKAAAEYEVGGGKAKLESNIKSLEDVVKELETASKTGENLTGMAEVFGASTPIPLSKTPRTVSNPRSIEIQEGAGRVITQTLRELMGPAFTEREGERTIRLNYNPDLDETANAKKLKTFLSELKEVKKAKESALQHYKKFGNLSGYSGPTKVGGIDITQADDFVGTYAPQPSQPSGQVKVGDVISGFRYLGGGANNPNSWEKVK